MENETDPLIRIGVAGALNRELSADHSAFVSYLATALQSAFPHETELLYEGGFLSKKKMAGVAIHFEEDRFELRKPDRGALSATKIHFVRGIALKTEQLAIKEWLDEVGSRIESRVSGDQASREALASALGLS